MADEEVMREYIRLKKQERRDKSKEAMGKLLSAAGRAFPKGIRYPDSLVTNVHLYVPGRRGKTTLH